MCAPGIFPENNSTKASQLAAERAWAKRTCEKKLGKRYLELGQALDGLQRPQHPEHSQGLDGLDVPPLVGSAGKSPQGVTETFTFPLTHRGKGAR